MARLSLTLVPKYKTLFLKGGQNVFHYRYKIKAGKNVRIKSKG